MTTIPHVERLAAIAAAAYVGGLVAEFVSRRDQQLIDAGLVEATAYDGCFTLTPTQHGSTLLAEYRRQHG